MRREIFGLPGWLVGAFVAAVVFLRPSRASAAAIFGSGSGKVVPGRVSDYIHLIRPAVARHPEFNGKTSTLVGLIQQESRFDPAAESRTGAAGLGQFTGIGRAEIRRLVTINPYKTRYANAPGLLDKLAKFDKPMAFVPDIAVEASALLLASLLKRYNGHLEAALTGYNAGNDAARIVFEAGSHAAAKDKIAGISQAETYAPDVISWIAKAEAGQLA